MKKTLLFIGAALCICWGNDHNSLYGDYNKNDITDNTISVAFDRFGDMYPSFDIDNTTLKYSGAALEYLFVNNAKFRNDLATTYGANNTSFFRAQRSIVTDKAKKINAAMSSGGYGSITFIMVGYNNSDDDAYPKLRSLEHKINTVLEANHQPKTLVVKVFWDGLFDDFQALRYSNPPSYLAGIGMRELLSQVDATYNINMISHSLGANLICETLFNQLSKVTGGDVKDSLFSYCNNPLFPTPKQKITVAIVAPAIPGKNTFIDYFDRNPAYIAGHDNYKIIVGFNSHDEVLRKILGGELIYHLSATSLG
jgi:hypothetical protein